MKTKKATYLSLVFLLSFLTSFSINIYQNNFVFFNKSDLKFSKDVLVSASEDTNASQDNLLFEENETEDGFELKASALPFFISYFQFEDSKPLAFSVQALTEKLSNPIYISVRNFRI